MLGLFGGFGRYNHRHHHQSAVYVEMYSLAPVLSILLSLLFCSIPL
jgi:hypothetical protein